MGLLTSDQELYGKQNVASIMEGIATYLSHLILTGYKYLSLAKLGQCLNMETLKIFQTRKLQPIKILTLQYKENACL